VIYGGLGWCAVALAFVLVPGLPVWLVDSSHVVVNELEAGPIGLVNQQASLNPVSHPPERRFRGRPRILNETLW